MKGLRLTLMFFSALVFAIFQAVEVVYKILQITSYHLKFVGPNFGSAQPITAGFYSTCLFFLGSLIAIFLCVTGYKITLKQNMRKMRYAFAFVFCSILLFDLIWISLLFSPFVNLVLR